MIAVLFGVRPKPDARDRYLHLAAELGPELQRIDGFIDVQRYRSLTDPDALLSLSTWRDEAAARRWHTHPGHQAAQTLGKRELFDRYDIRIARVVRSYGGPR